MIKFNWARIRILTIAIALALLPLTLVIYMAVAPIVSSIDQTQKDENLVQGLHALSLEKPRYEKENLRAKVILANQGILYVDSTAELASAQLQNTVQTLISQANGQIQSSAIIAPQTEHGLQVLTVDVTFNLPSSGLPNFLSLIDTSRPYLVVQSIDLRPTNFGTESGPLDVQMQVSGFSNLR